MVTAFAMRNFLKAAVGCLGMIAGCFSTGEAQDFGGMSFGEAGNFGPPQTSGSSKATVTSYGEASFVIVTELALPDHWHVYYKNPGTVGLPMEAALQPVPGFRVEGPFWQIPELGKGLVDFYGYSGKAKMAFRVTPEKEAPPEATFTTTMTWQMCAEQCAAPETKNFSVTLKRGNGQTAPDAAELTGNMAGLAAPDWAEGLKARISQEGKTVTLHLRTNGRPIPQDSVYFFCNQGEINPTTPQIFKKLDDSNYELSMQFNDTTDGLYPNNLPDADRGKPLTSLSGILRAGREGIIITADDRPFSGESQATAAGTESARDMAASVDKSKSLLRGVIYGVCALVVIAAGVGIYAWSTSSKKEKVEGENARLNALVVEGGKLGRSRLFDSKNLSRVPDVKVVPDAEDAALLLANVRGVKGNRENWPGAAHLVSIMAQMDDNIARQVVEDMKKNVGRYSKEKYSMMVTLLAKSSSPAMRDMLKDLYASISESKNKKIQDKQAVVLKYMRFAMKLDDLDDVMKILQKKDASPDLISSAFRTARYLIDEAPPAKRKALSSKLLQYQKDMPEENVKMLYKLLARTGDPKVLDMMEKSYKEDTKKALAIITAWGDWNTDDAVPYLFKAWKDESLHERVRSQAHDSILRVLSVDRDRDDNATLKLFDPLIADAKTSERRQFLVSAFKRLSNRPYVIRLLGRIKQTAEDQRNAVEPKFQAAEEALFKAEDKFKANPGDAAAKADYEAKEKIYNELSSQKTGEDKVIAAVDKALEKVRKTPVPTRKAASAEDRDDDDSSVIKTI